MAKKKVSAKDDFDFSSLYDDGGDNYGYDDNGTYDYGSGIAPIENDAPIPIGDNPFGTMTSGTDELIPGGGANGGLSADQFVQLLRSATGGQQSGGSSGGSRNGGLTNADGSMNWGAILAMLAAGGGGVLNHNATQQATQQTIDGLHATGDQVNSILGGAQVGYQPYMQMGQSALTKLQGLPQSNLASQFKPIGSGRGLTLANIAKGS